MIDINRKIFIIIILALAILVSSSVSYFTAMGWSASLNPIILEEEVDSLDDDYHLYPAMPEITNEDIELLEKIVMAEANGEPYRGQVAVVNVIINRVNSPWYPDTVREVIFQEGQFNPTWDGSLERIKGVDDSVKRAVNKALMGYTAVPENTLFFLNEDIARDFTIPNTRGFEEKIGNHSFYR